MANDKLSIITTKKVICIKSQSHGFGRIKVYDGQRSKMPNAIDDSKNLQFFIEKLQ